MTGKGIGSETFGAILQEDNEDGELFEVVYLKSTLQQSNIAIENKISSYCILASVHLWTFFNT